MVVIGGRVEGLVLAQLISINTMKVQNKERYIANVVDRMDDDQLLNMLSKYIHVVSVFIKIICHD